MSEHRPFVDDDVFPAGFVNGLEEYLSTGLFNFKLAKQSATVVKVVNLEGTDPGAGTLQTGVGFGGPWRFVSSAVNATVPGSLAVGTHDVFVTSRANDVVAEDAGTFDYSFGLKLLASGTTPSGTGTEALYRRVGAFVWNGTQVTDVWVFGDSHTLVVTSLPATPVDGQECYFAAGSNATWHLRWDALAAKWQFLGGGSLFAVQNAAATSTSGVYAPPMVGGTVSVTLPVAGDYMMRFGGHFVMNSATVTMQQVLAVNSSWVTGDQQLFSLPGVGQAPLTHIVTKIGVAAGVAELWMTSTGPAGNSISRRYIEVTPVRIG